MSGVLPRRLALFDVDGTLTEPRQDISSEMKEFLINLCSTVDIGFVGGADYDKHRIQLGTDLIAKTNYLFSQNGTVAYKRGELFHKAFITKLYSDVQLNQFINYILRYLSELELPIKRGTFLQFRSCMINICPLGSDASLDERLVFVEYDKIHHVRETMIEDLKKHFADYHFSYLIGGQTSFDVVPPGMDKTYCLQFLTDYTEIHFFGDKIFQGGNDHEIYEDSRTLGHHVHGPVHTRRLCEYIFLQNEVHDE